MRKNEIFIPVKIEDFYYRLRGHASSVFISIIMFTSFIFTNLYSKGQNPVKTFEPGAYIIDMGQSTQTIKNGLKPYGLVYQLIITEVTPVNWVINSSKLKDGVDFSANGLDYKGGSFIIEADRITMPVLTLINTWRAKGVVVVGPVINSFTAPVYKELTCWPIGVLDADNDGLIAPYYTNAEIPIASYKLNANPTMLAGCTGGDLYVLPHADPDQWIPSWVAALQNYVNNGGYVWSGCHAVSDLENIPGCNFLSNGGLVPYADHSDDNGNNSYNYNLSSNASPIMQFIGEMDVASANGSEQIYVPGASGWRSSTILAVNSPSYVNTKPNPDVAYLLPKAAVVLTYGFAFGDTTKGMVMYEAGHNLNNVNPVSQRVAAQRAFFNFVLMAGVQKRITINFASPLFIFPATTYVLSATASGGTAPYTYLWSSNGGGTFSSISTNPTSYTAPLADGNIIITIKVTDACGRVNFTFAKWNSGGALPIDLIGFEATVANDNVQLDWSTASEINNDYFSIQRSDDGFTFEEIQREQGAGNSNSVLYYSAVDYNPYDGISYYRLMQTDFDGKYTYSNLVAVDFVRQVGLDYEIYPNPFSRSTTLTINDASPIIKTELRIYNVWGEEVINNPITTPSTVLKTNNLSSGIYYYSVIQNNKIIHSGKLISQQ